MADLIFEITGWIGMSLVLLAYLLITIKKFDEVSILYHSMNFCGAVLIGMNSIINGAYPSGALNIIWTFIAIYGLIKGLKIFRK